MRGDRDQLRPGPDLLGGEADTAHERAVSDRDDDAGRLVVQLLGQLSRDRPVALVLLPLGAVLEERDAVALRIRLAAVLDRVEVACAEPDFAAQPLDVRELRLRSLPRARTRPHAVPSCFAAHAVAAPWFPVEAVYTASAPSAR